MTKTCAHIANDYGVCTLPVGHDRGHYDETNGHQWFGRDDDYGPGTFASIHLFDEAWRHEPDDCPRPGECLRCLRADRKIWRDRCLEALRLVERDTRRRLEEKWGLDG